MADADAACVFRQIVGDKLVVLDAQNAFVRSNPYAAVLSFGDGVGSGLGFVHFKAALRELSDAVAVGGNPNVSFAVANNLIDFGAFYAFDRTFVKFSVFVDYKAAFRAEPNAAVACVVYCPCRGVVQNCSGFNFFYASVLELVDSLVAKREPKVSAQVLADGCGCEVAKGIHEGRRAEKTVQENEESALVFRRKPNAAGCVAVKACAKDAFCDGSCLKLRVYQMLVMRQTNYACGSSDPNIFLFVLDNGAHRIVGKAVLRGERDAVLGRKALQAFVVGTYPNVFVAVLQNGAGRSERVFVFFSAPPSCERQAVKAHKAFVSSDIYKTVFCLGKASRGCSCKAAKGVPRLVNVIVKKGILGKRRCAKNARCRGKR